MKTERFSPVENQNALIVSSSNVASATAYTRSIAET